MLMYVASESGMQYVGMLMYWASESGMQYVDV